MGKKVSKTTLYAIQWLNHTKMSTSNIATELNIQEEVVTSCLSSVVNEDATSRLGKLIISETAGKRNRGVSIMTKEASFLSDEVSKQAKNQKKDTSNIFKPRG